MDIHPKARERFDERAIALRKRVRRVPLVPETADASPVGGPDIFVGGTITGADIVGPVHQVQTDKDGIEVARFSATEELQWILDNEAHGEFLALADAVRKQPSVRKVVSDASLKSWIWEWLRTDEANPKSLCDHLVEMAAEKVTEQTLAIPIHSVTLERPFRFGNVVFQTVSRQLLDELEAFETSQLPPSDRTADALKIRHQERRKQLQGRAVAVITIEAETDLAHDRAIDEADAAASILRLASEGLFRARGRSYCTVLGNEGVQTRVSYRVVEGKLRPNRSEMVTDSPTWWHLDADFLQRFLLPHLAPWELLLRTERNDFQEAALKAALILSRATVQERLSEKLLYALVAVEGLLLRDQSEPITVSLADRMAFLGEPDQAEERIKKVKLVREIYAYRSRFVHHAEDIDATAEELRKIEEFMLHTSLALRAAAVYSLRGGDRLAMLDELDARKYQ